MARGAQGSHGNVPFTFGQRETIAAQCIWSKWVSRILGFGMDKQTMAGLFLDSTYYLFPHGLHCVSGQIALHWWSCTSPSSELERINHGFFMAQWTRWNDQGQKKSLVFSSLKTAKSLCSAKIGSMTGTKHKTFPLIAYICRNTTASSMPWSATARTG